MTRTVFCKKYQAELEGLAKPPYPGPKGQDIFDNVSAQAWQEWQGVLADRFAAGLPSDPAEAALAGLAAEIKWRYSRTFK